MLKNCTLITGLSLSILLTACGGGEKKVEAEPGLAEQTATECAYSLNEANLGIYWKAFKHNAKVGVGGKFDSFEISGVNDATSIESALAIAAIKIDIASINSKDSLRDAKLQQFFFNEMASTEFLYGTVKELKDGVGILSLKMNDVTNDIQVTYAVSDENVLTLNGTVDVLTFGAEGPLATLHKACEEKHAGGDGESILWPEVEITIEAGFEKVCD